MCDCGSNACPDCNDEKVRANYLKIREGLIKLAKPTLLERLLRIPDWRARLAQKILNSMEE